MLQHRFQPKRSHVFISATICCYRSAGPNWLGRLPSVASSAGASIPKLAKYGELGDAVSESNRLAKPKLENMGALLPLVSSSNKLMLGTVSNVIAVSACFKLDSTLAKTGRVGTGAAGSSSASSSLAAASARLIGDRERFVLLGDASACSSARAAGRGLGAKAFTPLETAA